MAINKLHNGYAAALDGLRERFLEEWGCLYDCGIIPQKPIKAR